MIAPSLARASLAFSGARLRPSSGLCRLPARSCRPERYRIATRSQQAPTEQRESSNSSGTAVAESVPRSTAGRSVLSAKQEGASTDLAVILPRLKEVWGAQCGMEQGIDASSRVWHLLTATCTARLIPALLTLRNPKPPVALSLPAAAGAALLDGV